MTIITQTNISYKIAFVILMLMCDSFNLKSQSYEILPANIDNLPNIIYATYLLAYAEDSLNTNDINAEEMILLIDSDKSLFISYNQAYNDSVSPIIKEKHGHLFNSDRQALIDLWSSSLMKSRFNYKILKDQTESTTVYQDRLMSDLYYYHESLPAMEWNIDPGATGTHLSYSTQKATTIYGGRHWIAWFTTEIPISDGPYKFCGLPGLIVKLYDTENHYEFTLESIVETTTPIIPVAIDFPPRIQQTTRADFIKTEERYRHSFITVAQDAQLSPESQRIVSDKMRRRNNPIELKADL